MKLFLQEVLLASNEVGIFEVREQVDALSDGIDATLVLTHSVLGNTRDQKSILQNL